MRKEKEIIADLDALLSDYRSKADTLVSSQISEHNAKVRVLRNELAALYTNGAKKCPKCGAAPLGVLRKPVDLVKLQAPVYEVGCSVELNVRARGFDAQMAIDNWNDEKFV